MENIDVIHDLEQDFLDPETVVRLNAAQTWITQVLAGKWDAVAGIVAGRDQLNQALIWQQRQNQADP